MIHFVSRVRSHVGYIQALAAMVIVAGMLVVEAGFDQHNAASRILENFNKDSSVLTKSAARSMSMPLWEFDLGVLNTMAESLLENPSVLSVSIVETTGTELVEGGGTPQPVGAIRKKAKIQSPSGHDLGRLTIVFSDEDVRRQLDLRFRATVVRSFLVFTFLFLVLIWLVKSVTKPIKRLEQAVLAYDGRSKAQDVPGGDRQDELGSLARSFGDMADQIQGNVTRLETRVAERTMELEAALDEAKAASRAKSSFLATMSHEIRTPMNGVLGMSELLQQTKLTDKQSLYSKAIHESAIALLTILNDILDYSKIESGKLELDPTPFDLPEVVEDVATLLGVTARQKGVELMVRIRPNTPTVVLGDVGRFRQVLTNLVGNAVKFTDNGLVLIEATGVRRGEQADFEISVVDTGIGISEEKLEVIFDKFTQSEGSTTRRYGGTGLGLSISRSLIEAMGGKVAVRSKLGHGSTFTISVPFALSRNQVPRTDNEIALEGARSLVVDDIPINRTILSENLESWGAEVIEAPSAQDALEALEQSADRDQPIDLIISDYHMPDFDGLWLVRQVRASPRHRHVPVIILSSVDDDKTNRKFRGEGVAEVLAKPTSVRLLGKAIAKVQYPQRATAVPGATAETMTDGLPAEGADPDGRLRVLVADDNVVNRMVVMNMLGADGHLISLATNGEEAVCQAMESTFDLIFMDVSMPVMDGIEAMQKIRAEEEQRGGPRTPIVALTAHAMSGDRQRFLSLGMDAYLPKPITRANVQAIVSTLGRRTAR